MEDSTVAFLEFLVAVVADKFLQYPITCSLMLCVGLYIFAPLIYTVPDYKGWRWVLTCFAAFVFFSVVTVGLIPTLQMSAPRIIFRPTTSCSTFDDPSRYICFTLDQSHQQVFYITTVRECNSSDPKAKDAAKFYVISSWIPSFNHFRTRRAIQFQPAVVPGEKKPSYGLPENYCVRAAGAISEDPAPLKVAFYSLNRSQETLLDTGYIDKADLIEFHFGWYLVSSCRSDLGRWWYSCEMGYVSSEYVTLPEYLRIRLHEKRGDSKD